MTRPERIAKFRKQIGTGWINTSLCPVGAHCPADGLAIANWRRVEVSAHPQCFACGNPFSIERRPAAFLTARASRAPHAGTAVAGCSVMCWSKAPAEIEAAAADLLRRQLCPHGHFLDEGV